MKMSLCRFTKNLSVFRRDVSVSLRDVVLQNSTQLSGQVTSSNTTEMMV